MNTSKKSVTKTVRMQEDMAKQLEFQAAKRHRSFNSLAVVILEGWLKHNPDQKE